MSRPFKIFFKPDFLFLFLLVLLIALTVLGAIFESLLIVLFGLLVAAVAILRMLSGNLAARERENAVFSAVFFAPARLVRRILRKLFSDKTHVFVHCPVCTAKLRAKRTADDFTICCPSCATRFPIHID